MRTDDGPGMSGSSRSARRFRTVVALAAGIAIGVAMTATPVSGHVGNSVSHLWNAHIKPKTDARYYTKAQANARYAPQGAKAVDSELLDGLDSTAFLPAAGKAADAELLDGLDSTAFLRSNAKAADADQLDGLDSTAFLRTNGKAADAELLDGLDSTQFVRGNGQSVPAAVAIPYGPRFGEVLTIGGVIRLRYFCPATPSGNGIIFIDNLSPGVMNIFVEGEDGLTDPTYDQVPAGQSLDVTAAFGGAPDSFHIQAQEPSVGIVTVEVGVAHNPSNCHVQAQAVVAR